VSEIVYANVEKMGLDHVPEEQKHYYSVYIYDAVVCNGGHSEFYATSAGDFWPLALAGLTAMQSKERVEILRSSTVLFGSKGPATNTDERDRQRTRFSEKLLDELDQRYYRSKENINTLVLMYAIQHKDKFKAK
jgi:hypothetical protein